MEGSQLRVLVVGTGSAGCRHIENLLSLGAAVSAFRYRTKLAGELSSRYGIRVFTDLQEALDSPQDAVVVANRTDLHIPTALDAAQRGRHLYIEKPLSNTMDGVMELREIVKEKELVVEVGFMMRFHPAIRTIHRLLTEGAVGRPYLARVSVGQYLPDWRPHTDYRLSYSAKADQGGGVLLDLVHELDYLYWYFGKVKEVTAFLDNVSDLRIESEDIAQLMLRFESGPVAQVEMDYLSPLYRRSCEIVGDEGVMAWDHNSGDVVLQRRTDNGRKAVFPGPAAFERNMMFMDHMKHFLRRIEEGGEPSSGLEDAIDVQRIALAARLSSANGTVQRPSDMDSEVHHG